MRVTHSQELEVRILLSCIGDEAVRAIARTITCSAIPIDDSEEAFKCIMLHEKDLHTLLRRKKVTREALLRYLHMKNLEVAGASEKSVLVEKTVEYFESVSSRAGNELPKVDDTEGADRPQQNNLSEEILLKMGREFVQWFDAMLNTFLVNNNIIDHRHFWGDCRMKVFLSSGSQKVLKEAEGSQPTIHLLCDILTEHKIYFNPNLTNAAIAGYLNNHGLAVIRSCGTLHKFSECVGVFQQVFGLIRDPMNGNNWRIRFLKLCLVNEAARSAPSLQDASPEMLSIEDVMP